MTTGPKLRLGTTLIPGILAIALFGIMTAIVLNSAFGEMTGFPDGISITSEIGYAMFDLTALQSTEAAIGDTEQFLVAFILAAVVLDAALDASLVLAKREEQGEPVVALSSVAPTRADETDRPATDGGSVTSTSGSSETSPPAADVDPGGEDSAANADPVDGGDHA